MHRLLLICIMKIMPPMPNDINQVVVAERKGGTCDFCIICLLSEQSTKPRTNPRDCQVARTESGTTKLDLRDTGKRGFHEQSGNEGGRKEAL